MSGNPPPELHSLISLILCMVRHMQYEEEQQEEEEEEEEEEGVIRTGCKQRINAR